MLPDTTTCEDSTNRQFLKIIEQPTCKFRFRYRTEQKRIHGPIQGENSTKRKKTFPTVKLCNYDKEAYIRCTLYSADDDEGNKHIHAHRLLAKSPDMKEDKDDPHDLKVGPDNEYKACFQTLVIIHTPKNLIIEELVKKKISSRQSSGHDSCTKKILQEITKQAQQESENMDMNTVCLRFDALKKNPVTGELTKICESVYSKPIKNSRNPLTSDLKICRIDKYIGSCRGEEDVFIFVEKVCKDDIRVRFFELDENNEDIWCDYAKFRDCDVHHQYAIAFRTPPYRDQKIDKPVLVYFQLERPSDKCVSEKRDFQYKPEYQIISGSKRKCVEQTSLPSTSLQPLPQLCDKTGVCEDVSDMDTTDEDFLKTLPISNTPDLDLDFDFDFDLNGLGLDLNKPVDGEIGATKSDVHPSVESNPSSPGLEEFMKLKNSMSTDEQEKYYNAVLNDEPEIGQSDFSFTGSDTSVNSNNIVPDGTVFTQAGVFNPPTIVYQSKINELFNSLSIALLSVFMSLKRFISSRATTMIDAVNPTEKLSVNKVVEKTLIGGESTACQQFLPTKENLPQLVINAIMKMNHANNRVLKKAMLHQLKVLFSVGTNHTDGDGILHIAVMHGKETELEKLLHICRTYNMLSCIDNKNKEQKTPLHIAAKMKLEKSVELLLNCKADPSIQDTFGNTPLHYATMEEGINIVKMLVNAMESADIEARNGVGQTVLYIAVEHKSYEIVETLLKAGADVNWYNGCTGDTPLHVAVNNCDLQMVHILLKEEGIDVDAENFLERTPLMCSLDSKNTEAANEICCNALLEFKKQHDM